MVLCSLTNVDISSCMQYLAGWCHVLMVLCSPTCQHQQLYAAPVLGAVVFSSWAGQQDMGWVGVSAGCGCISTG
jgi:hypothetical protein